MNTSFQNIRLVAQREIWTVINTKGFILTLVLPAVMFFLVSYLPSIAQKLILSAENTRTESLEIGVIGLEPSIIDEWQSKLQHRKLPNGLPLFSLFPVSVTGVSKDVLIKNAQDKVLKKEWDAYAVINGDITQNGQCDFYSMRGFGLELPREIMNGLTSVVRRIRLEAKGFDPEMISQLSRGISWNEYEITQETASEEAGMKRKADFGKIIAPGIVCVMMMFFLTFTTSQMLIRGVVEEKTSRVVEILVSSLSPTEILAGKVLGFYIIGLIEFAVWVGAGVLILQSQGFAVSEFVPPLYFLHFLIFLTTGYLLYASIFAAIGAMVGDETESQQTQGIITMMLVLPLMFNFVFVTQPNWWLVRLISFIPVFTPTVMAIRMVAAPIPLWEIALTALNTLFFAVLCITIAARIFRVGILMTGKRPNLNELWRWIRYSDRSGIIET